MSMNIGWKRGRAIYIQATLVVISIIASYIQTATQGWVKRQTDPEETHIHGEN